MLQVRVQETLDGGDYGWLQARHHFAVSAKGNPANRALGALVVWNDDQIAPGAGFPRHSHADMEIITYVREGVVTHEDSAGHTGTTVAGDVQVMSAGAGVSHSEQNRGETPLRLFQIWLLPTERGGPPRWQNRRFPKSDRAGQLVALASGFPDDGEALLIRAHARVFGATLLADGALFHPLHPLRYAYLAPAHGALVVNGQRVSTGDGIAAIDERELRITAEEDAEFILVETD